MHLLDWLVFKAGGEPGNDNKEVAGTWLGLACTRWLGSPR